jgi:hypothetical protein
MNLNNALCHHGLTDPLRWNVDAITAVILVAQQAPNLVNDNSTTNDRHMEMIIAATSNDPITAVTMDNDSLMIVISLGPSTLVAPTGNQIWIDNLDDSKKTNDHPTDFILVTLGFVTMTRGLLH